MLGKLLKYEMKASARTLVPLYIGTLVVAAICSIQVALTFGQPNNADVWMIVGTFRTSSNVAGFLFLLFFGLCVAITVLTIMTVIQRFNTSLIGNEGYLMFTLPVTHAQLLSSKLIGAMLWSVIGTCVMFLALMIISLSGVLAGWDTISWNELWYQLNDILHNVIPMMFSSAVYGFCSLAATILLVYLSIMIAQTERFNNHRVVVAVVLFFVLGWAFDAVNTLIFSGIPDLSPMYHLHATDNFAWAFNWTMLGQSVFELVQAAICFAGIHWLMKNKLNL